MRAFLTLAFAVAFVAVVATAGGADAWLTVKTSCGVLLGCVLVLIGFGEV